MKRRQFLSIAGPMITAIAFKPLNGFSKPTDEGIAIKLPMNHRPQASATDADLARRFFTEVEQFKKDNPATGRRYQATLDVFQPLQRTYKANGWVAPVNPVNANIKDMMNQHGHTGTTPVFQQSNLATTFDDFDKYCDRHERQVAENNGTQLMYIMAKDGREDPGPFFVEADLARFMFQSSYWCIGLPSKPFEEHTITPAIKRDIYALTGIEATISSYRSQEFTFYGSTPLCGGLTTPPIVHTINYRTDEAVNKYYGFVPIEACGSPKDEPCKYKI